MEITERNIIELLESGSKKWNDWVRNLTNNVRQIKLHSDKSLRNYKSYQISLSIATFPKLNLSRLILKNFDFSRLNINYSIFQNVEFEQCVFYETQFDNSTFNNCVFTKCKFERTYFIGANLNFSKFKECFFLKSNLSKSEQYQTVYEKSTFKDTYLIWAKLIETHFIKTIIDSSKIYGASIWGLKMEDSISKNLIITKNNDSEMSVDNIEIAQFIHMLIDNKKVRNIITSLTSKVILILGRFSKERLDVLEGVKEKIKQNDYIPILFTFSPSANRDLTETIQLIANMSKMVFADITDPKSIPQELSHIIPFFPSLPVQPLILKADREYAMFEHWYKYPWVEKVFEYKSKDHLMNNIVKLIK